MSFAEFTKKFLLTVLIASLSLIYLESIFHTFLVSFDNFLPILILSFVFLCLSALASLISILFFKLKHKFVISAASLLLLGFALFFRGYLISFSDCVNFYLSKPGLESFAQRVSEYDEIESMMNLRGTKSLVNGQCVTMRKSEVDTTGYSKHVYFWKDVLDAEGIDTTKFNEFRERLDSNRLMSFSKRDDYIDFGISYYSGVVRSDLSEDYLKNVFVCMDCRSSNQHIRKVADGWYVY